MKTTKIVIVSYKDTSLQENIYDLFGEKDMTDEACEKLNEKASKIFEYGEFLSAELIVDEDLNIIGGKIIPHKK